jgi:hypothetical protein
LLDYLKSGANSGRDVRESRLKPLIHYRLYGAARARDPSPRPAPPRDQDLKELDPKVLFDAFQSLGDNCELGLVQKQYRSNLLGLFKFASTPIGGLVAALRRGFSDRTSPDHL